MTSELLPVTSEGWQMCPEAALWKYPSYPWIADCILRHGNSGKTWWEELTPQCITWKKLCHQAEHILCCSGKLGIHQFDPSQASSKHNIWAPLPARAFDRNIKSHTSRDELNRTGSSSLTRKREIQILRSQNVQFHQDLGTIFAQSLPPPAW